MQNTEGRHPSNSICCPCLLASSEGKKALKGLSKMFGGELESESEMEGGKISFKGIKNAYNKNAYKYD